MTGKEERDFIIENLISDLNYFRYEINNREIKEISDIIQKIMKRIDDKENN